MPARKVAGRWEETVQSGNSSGLKLTVTSKGVEAFGWFGSDGCSDRIVITWEDLETMKDTVLRGGK